MARTRLLGGAGGAVFAILTLIAFLIAPGPSSADGVTVVEYYTAHGDAAIWQAVLAGFGIVCFLWFAEHDAELDVDGPTPAQWDESPRRSFLARLVGR
jgi:hypothetical protein